MVIDLMEDTNFIKSQLRIFCREKKATWGWRIGLSSALLVASLVTFGISSVEFFRFLFCPLTSNFIED